MQAKNGKAGRAGALWGLKERSFAKCEALRPISTVRLVERWGAVSDRTIGEVEMRPRFLMGL